MRARFDALKEADASIWIDGFVEQDALQIRCQSPQRMRRDDAEEDISSAVREQGGPTLVGQEVGDGGSEYTLGAAKE